jgi:hypothetical protein
MNPKPIAPGFIAAHDPTVAGSPHRRRPYAIARSTAAHSPLPTVRITGATPTPDVIASFHPFLPNSNATYNVVSFTLT